MKKIHLIVIIYLKDHLFGNRDKQALKDPSKEIIDGERPDFF